MASIMFLHASSSRESSRQSSSAPLTRGIQAVPANIRDIRERLFHGDFNGLTLTSTQWDLYWPFVDNIYTRKKIKPPAYNDLQSTYYVCRLHPSKSYIANIPVDERIRQGSKGRKPISYPMKFEAVTDLYSKMVHFELTGGDESYNHTLNHSDSIKINTGLREAAAAEVKEGYGSTDITGNLTGATIPAHHTILNDAGGTYFTNKTTRNAAQRVLREHLDRRKTGKMWSPTLQQEEAVTLLKDEGYKITTIQAERQLNDECSRGIVFAREESMRVLIRRGYLTLMDSTHIELPSSLESVNQRSDVHQHHKMLYNK